MGAKIGARGFEILERELVKSVSVVFIESEVGGLKTAELLILQSKKGIVTRVNNKALSPVLCFVGFIFFSNLVGPVGGPCLEFSGIGGLREVRQQGLNRANGRRLTSR